MFVPTPCCMPGCLYRNLAKRGQVLHFPLSSPFFTVSSVSSLLPLRVVSVPRCVVRAPLSVPPPSSPVRRSVSLACVPFPSPRAFRLSPRSVGPARLGGRSRARRVVSGVGCCRPAVSACRGPLSRRPSWSAVRAPAAASPLRVGVATSPSGPVGRGRSVPTWWGVAVVRLPSVPPGAGRLGGAARLPRRPLRAGGPLAGPVAPTSCRPGVPFSTACAPRDAVVVLPLPAARRVTRPLRRVAGLAA